MSTQLTERQQAVLALTQENKNPTEIGKELGISSQGVHGHLRKLRAAGLLPELAGKKAADNGRSDTVTAAGAFREIQQSIARQQRDLATQLPRIDKAIEAKQDEIKALKRERSEAEKAIARLEELKVTVTA